MFKKVIITLFLLTLIQSVCYPNGIKQIGEQCDPNLRHIVPCTNDCKTVCNNGQVDPVYTGQQCDPSVSGSPPCSSNCKFCGNQQDDSANPNSGQECDPSIDNYNGPPCSQFCKLTCGDFIQQSLYGQQCDEQQPSTICDVNCKLLCGNGNLDASQQCDQTAAAGAPNEANCLDTCTLCGNGDIDDDGAGTDILNDETCDTAIVLKGDANWHPCNEQCQDQCNNGLFQPQFGEQCQINPVGIRPCNSQCLLTCGNGDFDGGVTPGQQCDPSSGTPGLFCDPITCQQLCGNGVVDVIEECDLSAPGNNIPCTNQCRSLCGNGVVDGAISGNAVAGGVNPNEECDPTIPGTVNCNPVTCQNIDNPPVQCGNGKIESGEECDDGNQIDDDQCDNNCQQNGPAVLCGNGRLDTNEQCEKSTMDNCDANCQVSLAGCGDGDMDSGQGCDDGNNNRGDGCSSYCQPEDGYVCRGGLICSKCGNGLIDSGQACDDANTVDDDGCDNQCQFKIPPYCGNGFLNSDEQCDDGNNDSGDGCSLACRIENNFICIQVGTLSKCSLCGNGKKNTGEACDDGNTQLGDGCYLCQVQPFWSCSETFPSTCQRQGRKFCGDGMYDSANEKCDDGDQVNSNGCNTLCEVTFGWKCDSVQGEKSVCRLITSKPYCGNGQYDFGEECEDGNDDAGDGCHECQRESGYICENVIGQKSTCKKYKSCGNGFKESAFNEACDDNNNKSGDGCDPNCFIEDGWSCYLVRLSNGLYRSVCYKRPIDDNNNNGGSTDGPSCGNSKFETGEQCDDGNRADEDGCTSQCIQQTLWNCVNTPNEKSTCYPTYTPPVCGDKILGYLEGCDDGNNMPGDGCSKDCQKEPGYICPHVGMSCEKLCSNGEIDDNEQCDDADSESGDGCSSTCKIEPGYTCMIMPGYRFSLCRKTCGNGYLEMDLGEMCDDNNIDNGDGCDANCKVENGYNCTNEPFAVSYCKKDDAVCGNGIAELNKMETCDDKNRRNGDGCNSNCMLESGSSHSCSIGADKQTYCRRIDFCNAGYGISEETLSGLAMIAIMGSQYSSAVTQADLVMLLIKRQNGTLVKNISGINEVTQLFNVYGIHNEWLEISHQIDLCV